jgi:hypothetical protein
MPSALVPQLTCPQLTYLAYTHLLTEFDLNKLTPVIVVPLGSNLLRLSDPELEPFRDEIMVWHINRRESQAFTCP